MYGTLSYMAGVAGFEPANAGIKTRCLAAWRHPNQSVESGQVCPKWRLADSPCDNSLPAIRELQCSFPGLRLGIEIGEHAGAGTRQPGRSEILQYFQRLMDFWVESQDEFLAIVSGVPLEKGRYFDGTGVACQFPVGKNFPSGNMALRRQDEVPAAG